MKDFPVFTTDWGVSSLILREIPYRAEAYIHIQDVQPEGFEEHLKECAAFCRMAGADRVYATGTQLLQAYPEYMSVYEMRGMAWVDPEKMVNLFPVTEQTVGRWRSLMNERLRSVDNAATLTAFDEKKILQSGGAYYIHRSGELLGLGWMEDTKLLLVAAVKPGAGETVMHSLMSLVEGADMTIEVASTNDRAIRLYEKLGFMKARGVVKWHKIV
ncbi:MAG: hypothetical protein IKY96_07950 [Oscillospiraceae bacterium]|nr:hypothetical protein [Oscillospiraceae bacterium]